MKAFHIPVCRIAILVALASCAYAGEPAAKQTPAPSAANTAGATPLPGMRIRQDGAVHFFGRITSFDPATKALVVQGKLGPIPLLMTEKSVIKREKKLAKVEEITLNDFVRGWRRPEQNAKGQFELVELYIGEIPVKDQIKATPAPGQKPPMEDKEEE